MVYVGDRFYKDGVKMILPENNRVEIISMFLDLETNEIIPLHDFKCAEILLAMALMVAFTHT